MIKMDPDVAAAFKQSQTISGKLVPLMNKLLYK